MFPPQHYRYAPRGQGPGPSEGWSSTGRESSHLLALQLRQSPFIPGHGGQLRPRPPPLPRLSNHVVNTRSPGQCAPPPGLRRTARQVMNGLPSSFSHAGTRMCALQRPRFNTPVTATANRINGPLSDRQKCAHASQASSKRIQTWRHNPFP